ncbi:MAG: BON domain-containing protein, partial [Pseudomonadota bacterium]|nr:BON domain-containing protein [Pseudomonadota bacterium]
INEIEVAESGGLTGYGRDIWISTRLQSALLFDKQVSSINYSIKTVRGTVYLIGIAQSRMELDRVINHARSLDYVRKVVNHVKIKRQQT